MALTSALKEGGPVAGEVASNAGPVLVEFVVEENRRLPIVANVAAMGTRYLEAFKLPDCARGLLMIACLFKVR